MIREQLCPEASPDELQLFLSQCRRTGLDPFNRQIYAVMRWNSKQRKQQMAIQTSIDGFRLIAQRTGQYAGQLGPFWCGEDSKWRDVWLAATVPSAAKVAVLRHDFAEPLWAVARFAAYAGTDKQGRVTKFWREMSDLMIGKCAEALALRRAFPQELSGLYTSDEMEQASEPKPRDVTPSEQAATGEANQSQQNGNGQRQDAVLIGEPWKLDEGASPATGDMAICVKTPVKPAVGAPVRITVKGKPRTVKIAEVLPHKVTNQNGTWFICIPEVKQPPQAQRQGPDQGFVGDEVDRILGGAGPVEDVDTTLTTVPRDQEPDPGLAERRLGRWPRCHHHGQRPAQEERRGGTVQVQPEVRRRQGRLRRQGVRRGGAR